jgi:hypothetical protein
MLGSDMPHFKDPLNFVSVDAPKRRSVCAFSHFNPALTSGRDTRQEETMACDIEYHRNIENNQTERSRV